MGKMEKTGTVRGTSRVICAPWPGLSFSICKPRVEFPPTVAHVCGPVHV